jgi:hypothetical protein
LPPRTSEEQNLIEQRGRDKEEWSKTKFGKNRGKRELKGDRPQERVGSERKRNKNSRTAQVVVFLLKPQRYKPTMPTETLKKDQSS